MSRSSAPPPRIGPGVGSPTSTSPCTRATRRDRRVPCLTSTELGSCGVYREETMRVLMLAGPEGMFGGHAVQRDGTAAALRSLGVEVIVDSTIPDRAAAFDVVHAWWPEL